jgi:hypothetical protein
MSKFIERHRRKGLLALLLFLLRQRKTILALLLVAVVLSFVFIAPSNLMSGPLGRTRAGAAIAWVASQLGLGGVLGMDGGKVTFRSVLAAFRSAKSNKDLSWTSIFGRGSSGAAGKSSISYVEGNAEELGVAGGGKAGPRSIRGIMTPEDAAKSGNGIALTENDRAGQRAEELARAGRGPNGYAGPGGWAIGADGAGGAGGTDSLGHMAAYAGRGLFGGAGQDFGSGPGAGMRDGDAVRSALDSTSVPRSGPARRIGGSSGKLSAARVARASYSMRQAMNRNTVSRDSRAFTQLSEGRAQGMIARDPLCTANNGCPAEYASTNVGAVYDGNRVGAAAPDVLMAPTIDGRAMSGGIPSDSALQGYMDEARKAQQDAQKCQESDSIYGPQEQSLSAQLQQKGDELAAMGCGSGGCSSSKAKRCKRKGNEMKAICFELYRVQCAHIMACPLTANDGCPTPDCNR